MVLALDTQLWGPTVEGPGRMVQYQSYTGIGVTFVKCRLVLPCNQPARNYNLRWHNKLPGILVDSVHKTQRELQIHIRTSTPVLF